MLFSVGICSIIPVFIGCIRVGVNLYVGNIGFYRGERRVNSL